MIKLRKKNTMLFPACLFCIFAFSSFLVLLYGIDAYSTIQDRSDKVGQEITPLSYLVNKVHSQDEQGKIRIEAIQGKQCLIMTMNLTDATYQTIIYENNHQLWELFIPAGREIVFQEGTPVMEVVSLHMKQDKNMLYFQSEVDDEIIHQEVALRSY